MVGVWSVVVLILIGAAAWAGYYVGVEIERESWARDEPLAALGRRLEAKRSASGFWGRM